MKQGHITFRVEGRLGNFLFMAANAMAFAIDHQMPFSMPTTSRDAFWCPTYLKHLAAPDFDPSLPVITIEERGYQFQEIPWDDRWREGHNIVLSGFWQSPRYWQHHRERILEAFGFPWRPMSGLWCAVHLRRGDALRYPEKHLIQSKEWIEAQMRKFAGHEFLFFSDDLPWAHENFGNRKDCHFRDEFPRIMQVDDERAEVQDLVDASCCANLIGSSSTFAIWIGLLQRNPDARRIFPKQWLVEGWESTTAKTWEHIMPQEWERA